MLAQRGSIVHPALAPPSGQHKEDLEAWVDEEQRVDWCTTGLCLWIPSSRSSRGALPRRVDIKWLASKCVSSPSPCSLASEGERGGEAGAWAEAAEPVGDASGMASLSPDI